MQKRSAPAVAAPTWQPLPVQERQDPAVRRRLSGPALSAFFNTAREWQLSAREERGLLGWPPVSTFHKYKSGDAGVLSFDTLTRISLVLGIYKALHILYFAFLLVSMSAGSLLAQRRHLQSAHAAGSSTGPRHRGPVRM